MLTPGRLPIGPTSWRLGRSAESANSYDPVARARWSPPSDTAILIYDEAEFRVGGSDVFRCGAKTDPRYRGETRYHDIVANRRIVWTEVIDELDKRLSVTVTTLELEPDGERAKFKLTVQLAALDGRAIIEGTKAGYTGALDNLTRELQRGAPKT
jgi:uncharacterized protein YndB with AHSA1/START domain